MAYLDKALQDKYAEIKQDGKYQKITHVAARVTERYDDSEEKVRAEFWAELVYRYQYDPQHIGVEVVVPDRRPTDCADLVVFRDATRKDPWAVIECKPDGISDVEFNQAIEQAFGNGHAHMKSFQICSTGLSSGAYAGNFSTCRRGWACCTASISGPR
jgi:type I restriction enzyme M protein